VVVGIHVPDWECRSAWLASSDFMPSFPKLGPKCPPSRDFSWVSIHLWGFLERHLHARTLGRMWASYVTSTLRCVPFKVSVKVSMHYAIFSSQKVDPITCVETNYPLRQLCMWPVRGQHERQMSRGVCLAAEMGAPLESQRYYSHFNH
jgi:hypothetical protein